ncbi:hypothetical protein JAAARDRAFT_35789 [Jaapia argillacea MUCL 33604]|uniref:GATA-type domain-containing protein n=1 Tax=Jaapia argillacea MUCL 33604 TaxID=933084 RepID=A0A067Q114_9AGAM|nr:hypothetical protein JAAARDRAFT_35789 [Jaapia argillacea MUCL 33604]
MSFITPPQRGFESHPDMASHLAHSPPRVHSGMQPQDFESYSLSSQANDAQPADHIAMPKVGETRCYWSLLSANLQFLYLDPVLASHLGPQAEAFVGKSLLAFVHPDEQASAQHDLGSVLESRTLHGSVTRVRYSRLSSVRRQLGAQEPTNVWSDGDKIAVDANYMAVDIVINWAAEGLVLCFMHAVKDLTPYDNDPRYKTGWTNWCGTPQYSLSNAQVQLMFQRIYAHVPQTGNMDRVFQILSNEGGRTCLMSWPPPGQGHPDGPTAKDFARLAEEVQIGGTGAGATTDAKTSCTRRYKALQSINMGTGVVKEVESIFIPHGSIIFACHKVNEQPRSTENPPIAYNPQNPYAPPTQHQQFYDQSYSISSIASTPTATYGYINQPQPQVPHQAYHHQNWTDPQSQSQAQPPPYGQWGSQTPSPTQPTHGVPRGTYANQPWHNQPGTAPPSAPMPFMEPSFQNGRPLTPAYHYSPTGDGDSPSAMSANSTSALSAHATSGIDVNVSVNDVVPPPRGGSRRTSPSSAATRENYGNGGRSSGHPPLGVLKCSSCRVTQSPEWRKGPSGKKDLCNACGLRYARSRAKKEGITSQRRRKDKALASASASPSASSPSTSKQPADQIQMPPTPSSPVAPLSASALRRSYDENASSVASSSGTPPSSQLPHLTVLNGLTPSPSPSPSAPNMTFAQQYSSHQNGNTTNTNSFYSTLHSQASGPSSNPAGQQHSNTSHHPPLPRLDAIHPYSSNRTRLSLPTTPGSGSPLATPSFDREVEPGSGRSRDHHRQGGIQPNGDGMLPTPVSAGAELPRRRV